MVPNVNHSPYSINNSNFGDILLVPLVVVDKFKFTALFDNDAITFQSVSMINSQNKVLMRRMDNL